MTRMDTIRVPMLFPGQASQAVGMARDLAASGGPAGSWLASVNDTAGADLTSLMFDGPLDTLTETWNAQPAILAHSVAVALELRELGIEASAVAGHSLGEFSAAAAVGALDPAVALALVRSRGELMFRAGQERPGTMAAIMGLGADQVREVCSAVAREHGSVVLANHNSEGQVVISGEIEAVAAAGERLKGAGARRVTPLNVSGAFHSPLLADAAATFAAELEQTEFADPSAPLVANVSARPVTVGDQLKAGLKRQLTSPVLWHDTMNWLVDGQAERPRVVLEVGPGKVLAGLARRAYPEVTFLSVGTVDELADIRPRLEELLAGPAALGEEA
ncbi:MAG: ACP S-malonyltransferase [Candidatus Krumholzibacteriia bacterium]